MSQNALGPGLYAHIPFCSHRCGYCDFATWSGRDDRKTAYLDALITDFERHSSDWPKFGTVFIGGGTPTQLAPEQLQSFYQTIERHTPARSIAEGTMEANPESLTGEHLDVLPDWQRRRISLGVQDLTETGRVFLERQHSPQDVERCVELARSVGDIEVNLDLIIGWQGQDEAGLRESLQRAITLEPDHFSVYLLMIEEATPFGQRVRSGTLSETDSDFQADAYALARSVLLEAGYEQYEISNFAKSLDLQSLHNRQYWEYRDWLGVGVSAATHRAQPTEEHRRWNNVRALDAYINAMKDGTSPIGDESVLTADEALLEATWLGMRLIEGVLATELDPAILAALQPSLRHGLVEQAGGRVRLTEQGLLLSDTVFEAILDADLSRPNVEAAS